METQTQTAADKLTGFIRNSATLKIFTIGVLVLVLLIPISMISSLMRERKARRDNVIKEINSKWGNDQTITGPYLTIPYKAFYKDEKNVEKYTLRNLHLLPENLDISGEVFPEIRYRSIYEAVLYNVKLNISGNFTLPDLGPMDIEPENVLWDKAVFSIGITDMGGIKDNIFVKYGDTEYKTNPGLKTTDLAPSGVASVIPLSPDNIRSPFQCRIDLNGSETIQMIPVAETSTVKLESNWPSPSFNGAFLPSHREVNKKGFTAAWKILHLNRNYPQCWTDNYYKVSESAFGLTLLITADVYQKSMRIVKYAVMFIVFTFAAFFFSEIINQNRVHPIQYLLIGLGIILFYQLLLAFSEHIGFNYAYIISAVATTLMITGYAKGILKSARLSLTVMGILVVLYAYLYIVLQLEDYALIMGSIGLFLVLCIIMYITRSIDWYALSESTGKNEVSNVPETN